VVFLRSKFDASKCDLLLRFNRLKQISIIQGMSSYLPGGASAPA
jgi:hypothetical protein